MEARESRMLGRAAAAGALAFVATALLGLLGVFGRDLFFTGPTTDQIVAWAAHDGGVIALSTFVSALAATIFYGFFVVAVVNLAGGRGVLPVMAYLGVAITVVVSWVQVGMVYAMVELAHQGGAAQAVRALFTLGETMQTVDSVGIALAVGCAAWLALRARALPAAVAWVGIGVAAVHLVEGFVQTQGAGIAGPIGVVLGLLWITAAGVSLAVRPVRRARPQPDGAAEAA